MPKFQVSGAVHATKYLGEFEAATPEEAAELAYQEGVSVCHQCSREVGDPEIGWVVVMDEGGAEVWTDEPAAPTPDRG